MTDELDLMRVAAVNALRTKTQRGVVHLAGRTDSVVKILLGGLIGTGNSRRVYACRQDSRYVVKVEELAAGMFQNIREWHFWQETPVSLKKWLAPCIIISSDGRLLLQRRCEPIPEGRWPEQIPAVFGDHKRENWGWLDGRPVMLDYALNFAALLSAGAGFRTPRWSRPTGPSQPPAGAGDR